MCDTALFAAHYGRVLAGLGQPVEVLPDGTIRTTFAGVHFLIANTAPHHPEFLLVDCMAPRGANPTTAIKVIGRTPEPHTVTLYLNSGCVIARSELILAGPGNLPAPALLAAVLPPMFGRLTTVVRGYFTELALLGIQQATDAADRAQPDLWT